MPSHGREISFFPYFSNRIQSGISGGLSIEMSFWSLTNNTAVDYWSPNKGKNRKCTSADGHLMYYYAQQNQEDIRFFESAAECFASLGLDAAHGLPPNVKEHFRVGTFGEFRRTTTATIMALRAWRLAVPVVFKKDQENADEEFEEECQLEFDGDTMDSEGRIVTEDGELRYPDRREKPTFDPRTAQPEECIIHLCRSFESCYIMFAGNHSLPRSATKGRLVPFLYCPFGKAGVNWRKGMLAQGFDKSRTYHSCDDPYSTFAGLMKHLGGVNCACHQAAFAFMETMYCGPHKYVNYHNVASTSGDKALIDEFDKKNLWGKMERW